MKTKLKAVDDKDLTQGAELVLKLSTVEASKLMGILNTAAAHIRDPEVGRFVDEFVTTSMEANIKFAKKHNMKDDLKIMENVMGKMSKKETEQSVSDIVSNVKGPNNQQVEIREGEPIHCNSLEEMNNIIEQIKAKHPGAQIVTSENRNKMFDETKNVRTFESKKKCPKTSREDEFLGQLINLLQPRNK